MKILWAWKCTFFKVTFSLNKAGPFCLIEALETVMFCWFQGPAIVQKGSALLQETESFKKCKYSISLYFKFNIIYIICVCNALHSMHCIVCIVFYTCIACYAFHSILWHCIPLFVVLTMNPLWSHYPRTWILLQWTLDGMSCLRSTFSLHTDRQTDQQTDTKTDRHSQI